MITYLGEVRLVSEVRLGHDESDKLENLAAQVELHWDYASTPKHWGRRRDSCYSPGPAVWRDAARNRLRHFSSRLRSPNCEPLNNSDDKKNVRDDNPKPVVPVPVVRIVPVARPATNAAMSLARL